MTKRKGISKRTRFEVLKRDSFTCQYCGKMPPDTILHIDHIKPVSMGGNNGMLNLVTSCQDCNLGKSNVELSDDSAVKKQQNQIAQLAEKKSQIEMMVEWRESLINSDEIMVDSVEKIVNSYLADENKHVSDAGRVDIRKAVKKHGYQKVIDAIEDLYKSNRDFSGNWYKSIAHCKKHSKNSIHYVKGILKNRLSYFNQNAFYADTNDIEMSDENYHIMVEAAKKCTSLANFFDLIEEVL